MALVMSCSVIVNSPGESEGYRCSGVAIMCCQMAYFVVRVAFYLAKLKKNLLFLLVGSTAFFSTSVCSTLWDSIIFSFISNISIAVVSHTC